MKITISLKAVATLVFLVINLTSHIVNSQLIGCRNNPCQNGGRCVDQPGSFYGYSCMCVGPWKGVNCDQYLNTGSNLGTGYGTGIGIGGQQLGHNQWQGQYPYNQQGGYNQYGQTAGQYNLGSGGYYQNQNQYPYNNNNNPVLGSAGQYGQYGYGGAGTACQSNPCYNGAYCQSNGLYSYTCLCRTGFYGQRCESYTNQNTITIGIIIGSIALFCVIVVAIAVIAYCCCCGRRN